MADDAAVTIITITSTLHNPKNPFRFFLIMNCRITIIGLTSIGLLFLSGCTIGDPSTKDTLVVSEVCTLPASYYDDKGIDVANKLHFAIDRSKLYIG